MSIYTKDQYIESLKGLKRNAFILGERVEDIVNHPINKPAVNAIAESYLLADERREEGIANTISHLTGEPVNRYNALNMSVEDLVARGEMERVMGSRTSAGCPRSTGLDAINALYSVAFEVDQKHGTGYLERFKDWLRRVEENDLAVSGAMTDVKGDRSKRPSEQDDPDMYVRVVKKDSEGVVVRGAKAHQTGAVNCHEHLVMPTRGMRESEADYSICFAIPIDTPGLYHIYGRQPSDTRKLETDASIDLGLSRFGGCETLMVFDDIFVPWERVFLCGETEFTWPLVNRFAIGHRSSYGVAGAGVGDVIIGAIVSMAESNGIIKDKIVWDKIADMIIMSETLYGLGLSSMVKGKPTPSGIYLADYVLGGVAKYNATVLPFLMCRIAQDICGGLVATMPSEMDLRNEEVGGFIGKYLKGVSHIPTEDRMRMIRLIECMSLGTFSADLLTMGLHGAGSPYPQKMMVLNDYRERIPKLVQLAMYHAGIIDEIDFP
jgi:4-hydroxybutyryl-CoA dehydratase/vinylacetyl-CoA-Delta-isomerase